MSVDKYQTKAGVRWRVRVDAPPDPSTGQRRRITRGGFMTRREAKVAERELLLVDLDVVANAEAREQTVAGYLRMWLAGYAARPTTLANYRTSIDKHLIPAVGAVKLRALRPEHLDRVYRGMETAGYRAKTVRHVHIAAHRALRDAVTRGYLERNPAEHANPPRQSATRSHDAVERAWDADRLAGFLAATAERRDAWAWRLLGVIGLRRGEVLGLRWRDVDLAAGTLRVARIVTEADGQLVEGPPKTRSGERTIALDADTVAALRRWRAEQKAERLHAGPVWQDAGDRVATQPDGQPTKPNTLTHRLKRLSARLGLPTMSPHGLRHTAATIALQAGVPVHVVSRRLGHADPAITLSVYAHVLGGDDQAAADLVASHLAR